MIDHCRNGVVVRSAAALASGRMSRRSQARAKRKASVHGTPHSRLLQRTSVRAQIAEQHAKLTESLGASPAVET